MQAIMQRAVGGPEVLTLDTVDIPVPSATEVVVRLHAAALNRRDVWIRQGQYSGIALPVIPGSDGAGIVSAIGSSVTQITVGQEVIIDPTLDWGADPRVQSPNFRILGLPDNGTYAQFVKVPAVNIYPKPAFLTWQEAAALPLAGLTAYRALITRGTLHPGETVLIPGIGGGVATFGLLFARALGARVFVTSRSDIKLARAQELGADAVFNTTNDRWVQDVRSAANGKGPDVVFESLGGSFFNQFLDVLRPGGRLITYGATLGVAPEVAVRRVYWKQLDILGSTMGSPEDFAALLQFVTTHSIRPAIDRVFPLAEAGAAQAHLEDAAQFGKVVLSITH